MTKNVIQLNGNTYDIRTGKLVSSNDASAANTPAQQKPSAAPSATPKSTQPTHRPAQHPTYNPVSKQPRKSQTLMRKSVSKPEHTPVTSTQQNSAPLKKRTMLNTPRFERASRANKSEHVHKFSTAPAQTKQQESHTPGGQMKRAQPAPQPAATPPRAAAVEQTRTPRQALEQSALERAESHQQEPHQPDSVSPLKSFWQRLIDAPAALRFSLAGLLMFGGLASIGYMSLPYLSVQLASSRSEISASLPDYKPSGFQLSSDVEYSPDHVALQYHSVSDNRSFHIRKQKTDWTSESLRSAFVEDKGLYQTVPSDGKTVYIFNESSATWVDDGIWYTVDGASSLTSDQLLRLADSL